MWASYGPGAHVVFWLHPVTLKTRSVLFSASGSCLIVLGRLYGLKGGRSDTFREASEAYLRLLRPYEVIEAKQFLEHFILESSKLQLCKISDQSE